MSNTKPLTDHYDVAETHELALGERLTRFTTAGEPSILEVADAEKYETYTEVIQFLAESETEPVRTVPHSDYPDNAVWRFAVIVRVIPHLEQFVILLRIGAGPKDLAFARRVVADIRNGKYNNYPWEQLRMADGQPLATVSLGEGVLLNEVRQAKLHPCDVPECVDDYHEWMNDDDDPMHVAEQLENSGYLVQVTKFSAQWSIYTDFDGTSSDLTPDEAISVANDLTWAAATARKLNAV